MASKAYMSDRAARETRPVRATDGSYLSPAAYVAERMMLVADAEREVRRILAETETASVREVRHFTPTDGYRDMAEVWIGDPREGNAHAALAEALAAFVAEE